LVEILERCVDSLKSMGSNDDMVLDLERQLNDYLKTLRHMIENKLENKETVGMSWIAPPPKKRLVRVARGRGTGWRIWGRRRSPTAFVLFLFGVRSDTKSDCIRRASASTKPWV
jgi:hypothetical protein